MSTGPSSDRITLTCTCGARLAVPANAVGRRVRCPRCQTKLEVAADAAPAKPRAASAAADPPAPAVGSARLTVTCQCGARLAFPASAAGRRGRCRKCGATVDIAPPPASGGVGLDLSLEDLARGEAAAATVPTAATAPAARPRPEADDDDMLPLRLAPAPDVDRRPGMGPPTPKGPEVTCPSCARSLPAGTKICVACGINVKTGRTVLTSSDEHVDQACSVAEGLIRWLSWLIWVGVYPIASEAFGLRKPWVIRGVAALTVLVSVWYIAVVFVPSEPSVPERLGLMLWCGRVVEPPAPLLAEIASEEAAAKESKAKAAREKEEAAAGGKAPGEKGAGDEGGSDANQADEGEEDENEEDGWEIAAMPPEIRAVAHFHWYQLFTHALLHGGLLHLAGNMLFLMVLGTRVNALIGNVLTVALYPLLAMLSALAHMATCADQPLQSMLGASGAIMGLAGMYLVLFPVNQVHMAAWWRWGLVRGFHLSLTMFAVRGFWVVLFYIAFDVFYMAIGIEDEVAHGAHLGGFIAGVVIALILLVARVVDARGGDLVSAVLGRYAWPLLGKPNARRISLP